MSHLQQNEVVYPPVITVDGASGTVKGTNSQLLASHLGWHFLDSGALYRVLALAAVKHSVALDNGPALHVLAEHLDVQFIARGSSLPPQIILESEDVTETIRTEKIGNAASIVGALPDVRAALLSRQRVFREFPGLVADGRDMGSVVFPDAELKIFLLASPEERASRRLKQLKDRGINVNLANLVEELRERDRRDSERAIAPLKPAMDAISIETDHLTIDQVVERILVEIAGKKAFPVTSNLVNKFIEVHVTE